MTKYVPMLEDSYALHLPNPYALPSQNFRADWPAKGGR